MPFPGASYYTTIRGRFFGFRCGPWRHQIEQRESLVEDPRGIRYTELSIIRGASGFLYYTGSGGLQRFFSQWQVTRTAPPQADHGESGSSFTKEGILCTVSPDVKALARLTHRLLCRVNPILANIGK